MKKFFTLLSVAMMAISVSAQETALFENGGTYNNGATISSANAQVVLGNDRTSKPYDVKLASAKAYCAPIFGQTVQVQNEDTGEMEDKTRVVYVVGNQNPKDGELDGDKPTGSGYKEESANLPNSGTYYMFTPKTDGHVVAFIVLNSGKSFFICKASDGSALPMSDFVLKADGEEATVVTLNDDRTSDDKVTGTVEFDVVANETYYIFCTGSKLSFGGYQFTSTGGGGGETGGESLATDPALPITFDTWDANFLIPKTDVKAGDKFLFTCETIEVEGWQWGPQVLPKSNADWSNLGDALVPENGIATFEVTEDFAAVINGNGGLRIQGMGVKITAVTYEAGTPPTPPSPEGGKVSIIDKFTYTWNDAESIVNNADGSLTYNSAAWGGLAAWVAGDAPADWSGYVKLVFEFAEPTTVNVQGFVQTATPEDIKYWGNAGLTTLECPLEGKNVSNVNQVALQTSEPVALNITAIYLVENAAGIENTEVRKNIYDVNAPVYNLAGMRVNKDFKGVVIQNGRKYIQK